MANERIILGIDPGTTIMGFGLIKVNGKSMEFLQLNELHLQKYDGHYLKLKLIFERTLHLIDTYHPDEIAIEAPFFGKNVQSMLKLGRAQGVAMAAGLSRQIPITEYSPKKIKMAITGSGNASKEQVAKMLQTLLELKELPKNLDATDGLAAAVCH
ncbi:MAG: crossover junction endodeoxyribonuclease RuvC, partial [Flavobacteriaceae bacterium]|nr:crossover junction endodeoxyribonuclease RuvC [Flavobacteriaceae bacterium]